jgi:hypothetical protein
MQGGVGCYWLGSEQVLSKVVGGVKGIFVGVKLELEPCRRGWGGLDSFPDACQYNHWLHCESDGIRKD